MSRRKRFEDKIDKNGPNGCWVWTAAKNKDGYGVTTNASGKTRQAHRISYVNYVGRIPKGAQINHTCGNPACQNPEHLYAGTQQDNMNDRKKAGKYEGVKGEANHNAKLTRAEISQIKRDYKTGRYSHVSLGFKYAVSPATIGYILSGKRWS